MPAVCRRNTSPLFGELPFDTVTAPISIQGRHLLVWCSVESCPATIYTQHDHNNRFWVKMALNRKYSALPDLDTAPDVYETPELTDDNSTVLTAAAGQRSGSDTENSDDEADISRPRVHLSQARSRFSGAIVDAKDANFSDRIDRKRASYRTTTAERRRRRHHQELGDLTGSEAEAGGDDDDDYDEDSDSPTGLERKIARLKREVEETKAAYAKQKAALKEKDKSAVPGLPTAPNDLDSLSQALEGISRLTEDGVARNVARFAEAAAKKAGSAAADMTVVTTTSTAVPPALEQAADFDRRLALLERAIGVGSSLILPDLEDKTVPYLSTGTNLQSAILPSLHILKYAVATLSSASTASLDGISRRVRTLIQDAENLAKARLAAKDANDQLLQARVALKTRSTMKETAEAAAAAADILTEDSKINALYATLPTIEGLAPLLPPLLDRLRSLREIHADAATASELLDDLAQQQADTAAEVKQWREGLEKMEVALREGEVTMGKNAEVMEGWVKQLEARLDKLE
ncbi:dynamitin-like protein [Ophiostoma piceae UAMH 11346]|uniref:Dynamitin-like protein n=1 Tax=Ophiostoma piceae (strain UAMH 11346) TaxID=1262450 RepID=S3BYK3_OPHP1|nr:dynamitin-like protein [Ophiostoma piceae UAMH 11346]